MKSILIIDTPNDCYDCPCYYEDRNQCEATLKKVKDVDIEKPSWCPLRSLPCKKYMRQMPSDVLEKDKRERDFIIHKVDVDNSYVEGWNDCLGVITGETE